jgi:hypothetical protein
MYNYVQKVFVGKASGAVSTVQAAGSQFNPAIVQAGDLYLTDETGVVLDAAAAATATTALVVRGTGVGTAISSMPIKKVRGGDHYTFQAYTAPVAQVVNFADLGLQPNTQYKLQVVLPQDLSITPNRQDRVEAYVQTGATVSQADVTRLISNFNKQRRGTINSLIVATANGTTGLTLTSQPIPTVAIDDYQFVRFEANFVSIAAINALSGQLSPVVFPTVLQPSSQTAAVGGSGLAVQVRALERVALGYAGYTDLLEQHIRTIPYSAVDGVGYDLYNIQQHLVGMGEFQDTKTYPQSTLVAVATGSAQKTAFGAVLDAFMQGVAPATVTGE